MYHAQRYYTLIRKHPVTWNALSLAVQELSENSVFPVGGGLLTRIDPRTRINSPYKNWPLSIDRFKRSTEVRFSKITGQFCGWDVI